MSRTVTRSWQPIVVRPGVVWHELGGRELHLDQRLDGAVLRLLVAALDESKLDPNDVVLAAVQPVERRVSIEYFSPSHGEQVDRWTADPANRAEDFDPVTRVASVVVR